MGLLELAFGLQTIGYHTSNTSTLQEAAATYRRAATLTDGNKRVSTAAQYNAQMIEKRLDPDKDPVQCGHKESDVSWRCCEAVPQRGQLLASGKARIWGFESTVSQNGTLEALLFAEDVDVAEDILQVQQSLILG